MATKAQLENTLRSEVMEVINQALADHFHVAPALVGSGEIVIAVKDAEGNQKYPKIKVSIPRGTRDGEGGYIPYNGVEAAEEYRFDVEAKEQDRAMKQAQREAKKGKKKYEEEE